MKRAIVYGAGMSGMGAQKLLLEKGYDVLLVDDKKAVSSEEALKHIDGTSLFIKSPGIPYTELVVRAREGGVEIIDELELAYRELSDMGKMPKIIAVTGTNGKTTVTTKIKEMLEFCGRRSEYAGNIGRSFAELVLEIKGGKELDYIVLEMSSYQLENLDTFKADIAMVVNLAPDHLDRYRGAEEYYDTKMNITMNQSTEDYFILNVDSHEIMERGSRIGAQRISISRKAKGAMIHCEGERVVAGREEVANSGSFSLKGKHNLENQLFIMAVALIEGLDWERVREFLYNTGSLEHRMEEFYTRGKTLFVNDSKGTNLESTLMAVGAYEDPIVILGGVDKKLDLTPLVAGVGAQAKAVYLIGEIGDELERLFLEAGYPREALYNEGTLDRVVEKIYEAIDTEEKNTVLLSPATASFDQFKSYLQRGDRFKELIRKYFRKGE